MIYESIIFIISMIIFLGLSFCALVFIGVFLMSATWVVYKIINHLFDL